MHNTKDTLKIWGRSFCYITNYVTISRQDEKTPEFVMNAKEAMISQVQWNSRFPCSFVLCLNKLQEEISVLKHNVYIYVISNGFFVF
jgi:hypothetical protein